MKNFFRKYFSVPVVIYFVIFGVCFFLLIPKISGCGNKGTDILSNISYSLLASNIAGILFDLGNNYKFEKESNKRYNAITNLHSQLLNDIIIVVDYTCDNLCINKDISFLNQLESILLYNNNEKTLQTESYIKSTEDIGNWLNLVAMESEKMLSVSYIMNDNPNFDEKKRTRLRLLTPLANEASMQFKMHTLESHKKVYNIINSIIKIMIQEYPEQGSFFD